MSVAKCPQCEQLVTAPNVDRAALVRCPHCQADYSIQSVLRCDIPDLILIDSHAAKALPEGVDQLASDETAQREVGPRDADMIGGATESYTGEPTLGEAAEVELEATSVPSPFAVKTEAAPAARSRLVTASTRSRRTKNPIAEMMKFGLGGIAGILIAQGILWWLPGSWKRDPIGLATRLPASVSFLAPAALRSNRTSLLRPETYLPSADAERGNPFTDEPATDPSHTISPNRELDKPATVAAATQPADEQSTDDSTSDTPGYFGPPAYTGAELQQALASVVTAMEALNTNQPDGNPRERKREFYRRLCDVAQIVSFVDVEDDHQIGKRMQAVEALIRRLGDNTANFNLVGVGAAGWLTYPSRTSDGIALAGRVRAIRRAGKLFESEIVLAGRSRSVLTVVSLVNPIDDPRLTFDVGSQVVILGSVVIDPHSQLTGYEGNQPIVIWRGLHGVSNPSL